MLVYSVEHNEGPTTKGGGTVYIDGVYTSREKAEKRFDEKFPEMLPYYIPEGYSGPGENHPYGESSLPNARPLYRCCANGWWWGIFEVEV